MYLYLITTIIYTVTITTIKETINLSSTCLKLMDKCFLVLLFSASPILGFLDDYAFVVSGLLDLFEATQTVRWLQWASELQHRQDQLFWDAQGSGYFCSDPSDPTILLSLKLGETIHTSYIQYTMHAAW